MRDERRKKIEMSVLGGWGQCAVGGGYDHISCMHVRSSVRILKSSPGRVGVIC